MFIFNRFSLSVSLLCLSEKPPTPPSLPLSLSDLEERLKSLKASNTERWRNSLRFLQKLIQVKKRKTVHVSYKILMFRVCWIRQKQTRCLRLSLITPRFVIRFVKALHIACCSPSPPTSPTPPPQKQGVFFAPAKI